jgi:hypothetical protein
MRVVDYDTSQIPNVTMFGSTNFSLRTFNYYPYIEIQRNFHSALKFTKNFLQKIAYLYAIYSVFSPISERVCRVNHSLYTEGYIKLSRKLLEWGWYNDQNTVRLFFHLLLCANYKDCEFHNTVIKRGQLVTSRKKLSEQLGLTEREIRTALEHLTSTNDIAINSTPRYSIITVKNDYLSSQPTNKTTSYRPTSDQQATSDRPQYKKDKKAKKDNKARNNTRVRSMCEFDEDELVAFRSKMLYTD